MPWPTLSNYAEAIRDYPHISILDPELQGGEPQRGANNNLIVYSGGFSCVFPIEMLLNTYALRCWTRGISNAETRYREISDYLRQYRLPYFVDFAYVPEGILVNGERYPITRMEWAEGDTLCDFIEHNLQDARCLRTAAVEFQNMVAALHAHQISHGDLQDGNILLKRSGTDVEIKLIDYDSVFVPALSGQCDTIRGVPAYQHPQRIARGVSAAKKMDYFSELVIYLSLLSLAERPDLWSQFGAPTERRLLFIAEDFENPDQSDVFQELENLSSDVRQLASKLKEFCNRSVDQLDPLEAILPSSSPVPPPPPPEESEQASTKHWQYITGALAFILLICIMTLAMQLSEKDEVLREKQRLQNQLTEQKQKTEAQIVIAEKLRNEKEELLSQNQELRNENTMLQNRSERGATTSLVRTLSNEKAQLLRENERLQNKLTEQDEETRTQIAVAERLRSEKEELRSQLTEQNKETKTQIAIAERLRSEKEELRQRLQDENNRKPSSFSPDGSDRFRAEPLQKIDHSSRQVGPTARSKNNQGLFQWDYSKAIELFDDAKNSDSQSAKIHYNLGTSYLAMKEYAKSINFLEQAVNLDPNFKEAHYNLALAYLGRGDRQEAKEAAQDARSIDKNYRPAGQLLDYIKRLIRDE